MECYEYEDFCLLTGLTCEANNGDEFCPDEHSLNDRRFAPVRWTWFVRFGRLSGRRSLYGRFWFGFIFGLLRNLFLVSCDIIRLVW